MLTLTESTVQAGGIAASPAAADSTARALAGHAGEGEAEIRLAIAPPPGEEEELVEDETDEPTEEEGDEPGDEDEEARLRVRSDGGLIAGMVAREAPVALAIAPRGRSSAPPSPPGADCSAPAGRSPSGARGSCRADGLAPAR